MTTTTSPAELEHAVSSPARSGTVAGGARRRPLRLLLIVAVVLATTAAGTVAVRELGSDAGDADLEAMPVTRRSFPVMIREKGELKAANSVDVKCQVEGRSTIIWLIEEGTEVKQGDLLVRLASDQIEEKVKNEEIKLTNAEAAAAAAEKEHEILLDQNASDLRKAQLALDMAEIEKRKYLEGDYVQTINDIELELRRAKKVLERAESDLVASKELHEGGFISMADLANDEIKHLEAENALTKARLKKEIEEKYNHPKLLQQKESDVEEATKELARVKKSNFAKQEKSASELEAKKAELALIRERLAKYRQQQANCEIRAPQAGLVVYDTGHSRWDRRQITEGAEVYERQSIIKLPDPSVMVVQVRIHEAKTNRIERGQPARVRVEGIPDEIFTGKVTKIAVLADSQNMWLNPDLKEYETEITLDQSHALLKPGMTARADIIVDQVEDVLAVPVQSIFSKAGHHFVFRDRQGDCAPLEVELGVSSDEFVEVVDGVAENDRILLAVSEDMRRMLPDVRPVVPPGGAGPPADAKTKRPGGGGPRKAPGKSSGKIPRKTG